MTSVQKEHTCRHHCCRLKEGKEVSGQKKGKQDARAKADQREPHKPSKVDLTHKTASFVWFLFQYMPSVLSL